MNDSKINIVYINKIIPGMCATTVSVILGYPFDTVKTRMQTKMFSGVIDCVKTTFGNEGLIGFYRGVTMPFVGLVAKRTFQFRIYDECLKYTNSWMSGFIASSFMSPLGNPISVIKIRMQDSTINKYNGITTCIKDIYKTNGISGFFRGVYPNLMKDIMFGTLYLGLYGYLKDNIFNNYSTKTNYFLSGGLSGSITWIILMPIDTIKTTIQSGKNYDFIKNTIKTDGVRFFWKGSVPTLLRIFPVSAMSMMTYGIAKDFVYEQHP